MKRDLAGVGGDREREQGMGEVDMSGEDGCETGPMRKKRNKFMTDIGASLTPDYRDKEVSVPASLRTTGIKRYRCQPHPGLRA